MKTYKLKEACFLGDSITDGVGVNKGERYFDLIAEKLGIKTYGYGVNGAQFIGLKEQIKRMKSERGENVDAIFVFAGTNDYNGGVPVGEWFSETQETVVAEREENGAPKRYETRKKRVFDFDESTFCGRINTVLSLLKRDYAEKEIILITPIHRAFAEFGPSNIQYDERYSNSIGEYLDAYVDAVRKGADLWSVRLIDAYRDSGLFPLTDESAKAYFANFDTDRLHPGKVGHERLAELVGRYIINNL
ncbi:MAG: SGNH/GDSL hydrolase family protein [Clostridia bacterium]|nr:SGNH/GDSL hydrolase family protein [Clostridia bacterium]